MDQVASVLGLYFILAITLAIYWIGVSGEFLLDDFPNLEKLRGYNLVDDFDRVKHFVLSGRSGPLGRPLSLLTFLINDIAWPSDARSFKYTNIMIHLLNGVLVYLFSIRLLQLSRESISRNHIYIATMASALWLLHPLNVSTVLYVIQRMTELSALFVLSGLLAYLRGRRLIIIKPGNAYIWMTISLVFAALGILCKESAALFPALVLVIEFTLVKDQFKPNTKFWYWWSGAFLVLPIALIIGWHIYKFQSIQAGYLTRSFTLVERLLTESRVLFEYLGYVLFPRRIGTGLFHDDFSISQNLLNPPSTLIAIISISAAIIFAFKVRKRYSILSFAIFWYIVGHLLEAGPAPLEIYFEHRNYLPMIGPLLALCYGAFQFKGQIKYVGVSGIIILCIVCGIGTYQNTTLWSNAVLLAEVWAEEHPDSGRAQQFSANMWAQRGRFDIAQKRIQSIVDRNPLATSAYVELVQINCLRKLHFEQLDYVRIINGLSIGVWDPAAPKTIQIVLKLHKNGSCPGLNIKYIDNMIDTLLKNRHFRYKYQSMGHLYFLRANVYESLGNFNETVKSLNLALKYHPAVDVALYQAHIFASAGNFNDAIDSLQLAEKLDRHRHLGVPLRSKEIKSWEQYLEGMMEIRNVKN